MKIKNIFPFKLNKYRFSKLQKMTFCFTFLICCLSFSSAQNLHPESSFYESIDSINRVLQDNKDTFDYNSINLDLKSKLKNSNKDKYVYAVLSNLNLYSEKSLNAITYFLKYLSLNDDGLNSFYFNINPEITIKEDGYNNQYLIDSLLVDTRKEDLTQFIDFSETNKTNDSSSAEFYVILSKLYLLNNEYLKSFENYLTIFTKENGYKYTPSYSSFYCEDLQIYLDNLPLDTILKKITNYINKKKDSYQLYDIKKTIHLCNDNKLKALKTFAEASLNHDYYFNNYHYDFIKMLPEINNKAEVTNTLKKLIGQKNIDLNDLATLFVTNKDYELAFGLIKDDLKRSTGTNPIRPLDSPIETILKINDKEVAKNYVDKVTQYISNSDYYLLDDLVEAYIDLNEYDTALKYFEKSFDAKVTNKAKLYYYELNGIAEKIDNINKVLSTYNSLTNKHPNIEELAKNKEALITKIHAFASLNNILKENKIINSTKVINNSNLEENYNSFLKKLNHLKKNYALEALVYFSVLNPRFTDTTLQNINFHKGNFKLFDLNQFIVNLQLKCVYFISDEDLIDFYKKPILQTKDEKKLIQKLIKNAEKQHITSQIETLIKLSELYDYSQDVLLSLTNAYISNDNLDKASETIEQITEINPIDAHFAYKNASINYNMLIKKRDIEKDIFGNAIDYNSLPFSKRPYYYNFVSSLKKALKINADLVDNYDFKKVINNEKEIKELINSYKNN